MPQERVGPVSWTGLSRTRMRWRRGRAPCRISWPVAAANVSFGSPRLWPTWAALADGHLDGDERPCRWSSNPLRTSPAELTSRSLHQHPIGSARSRRLARARWSAQHGLGRVAVLIHPHLHLGRGGEAPIGRTAHRGHRPLRDLTSSDPGHIWCWARGGTMEDPGSRRRWEQLRLPRHERHGCENRPTATRRVSRQVEHLHVRRS